MTTAAEPQSWTDYRVAYGLLFRDDSILIVGNRWRWAAQPELVWTLPGGRTEPGEPILDALLREFREETGLEVRPGPLWFVVEVLLPATRQRFVSFVFRVEEDGRTAPVTSPADDAVAALRFVSAPEAPDALSLHTMRGPLAAHLANPDRAPRFYSFTVTP